MSNTYFPEYQFTDDDGNNMPVITLEVMSDCSADNSPLEPQMLTEEYLREQKSGLHFLTENPENTPKTEEKEEHKEPSRGRSDLLEYMMRQDGSVICKLCGEVLQSRTHWYRHKYKLHVVHPLNPAPLFQCEHCLVYFKSRKGYIGHIASRHSEVLAESNPVQTTTPAEAAVQDHVPQAPAQVPEDKEMLSDPEMSIPKTSLPKIEPSAIRQALAKSVEGKTLETKFVQAKKVSRHNSDASTTTTNQAELDEQRSREEKLVSDIIDRVRRECEAQGSGAAARRGYTRRYTVMHT